jgi:hypothetical protein
MSKREWESGIITIPAKQWKSFVADLDLGESRMLSDFEIELNHDKRTVHWSVYEGNHACEEARRTPEARRLFKALDRIQWTRGSGGTIAGNDEYNQDCQDPGGGANYVVKYYGVPKKRRSYR